MNNILIVLGVVCLQVVFGQVTEADLPASHKECLKELNLPAELYFNNLREDFTINEGVPDFNKLILCTYQKGNFLNPDNTLINVQFHNFLVDHFMKVANITTDNDDVAATNAINACSAVEGTDSGDMLVKNYNCILKLLKHL